MIGGVLFFGTVVAIVYGLRAESNGSLGVVLLAAGAALAAGVLLGFIFGIPRSLQGEFVPAPSANSSESREKAERPGSQPAGYRANTNLEQISDWLTKILVGVGLTQLDEIPGRWDSTARRIALGLDGTDADHVFAGALLFFFSVFGFIYAYLRTRVELPGMFRRADLESIEERTAALEEQTLQASITAEEARERSAAVVEQSLQFVKIAEEARASATAAQIAGEDAKALAVGIGRIPSPHSTGSPGDPDLALDSDPWKNHFGGVSEHNGRRLTATVEEIPTSNSFFRIHLEVCSTDASRPIASPVQFFLHPTFNNPEPIVRPSPGGCARLDVTAWGAFTVGAVTDDGSTKLELDLANLPGAPEEFRSR